jgi:RNA polymerase sigma factor (sigma-70 family)
VVLPPFQILIDAHAGEVSRLCRALAGADDGADCAQATWLAALRAYPALKSATNLRGWLLTIAARTAIDHHRARNRRAVPVASVPDRPVGDHQALHNDDLWAVVRTLPDRQRHAVALRYVLDLPHADVARSLGVSESMSRRLVSDALTTLRTKWSQT